MEKLITRKEAARILGISIATLDAARNNGLISYVQYLNYDFSEIAAQLNAIVDEHFSGLSDHL